MRRTKLTVNQLAGIGESAGDREPWTLSDILMLVVVILAMALTTALIFSFFLSLSPCPPPL